MNHSEAIEAKSPMRYVLGELAPADRDEFEEHLADCSHCMNEVWMATSFAANAKEVFRERAAESARAVRPFRFPRWSLAFSAALNILLAAGLGYAVLRVFPGQRAEIAELNEPAAIDVVPVRAVERDASPSPQVIPARGKLLVLSFDLPQPYEHFFYSIAAEDGGVRLSGEMAGGRGDSLNLRVPLWRLTPGRYKVTVTGLSGSRRDDLGSCLLQVNH